MSALLKDTKPQSLDTDAKPKLYARAPERRPLNNGVVPEGLRLQFDCQGFVILRNVLDQETVQRLKNEFEELEQREYDNSHLAGKEVGMPVKCEFAQALRLNGLPRISPVIDELIGHESIMPFLDEFVTDPMLINTWFIDKYQGKGSVGWHSGLDAHSHYVNNGRSFTSMLNTIWALDENNTETGCPIALPGSHKRCFNPTEHYDLLEMPGSIPVLLEPGDVFIFSEATLHGGLPRKVPGSRKNVYINYVEGCRSVGSNDGNLHNYWLPPEVRARFPEEKQRLFRWMETSVGA